MNNPKTTVHIAGHPIHPMLVPFPIMIFTGWKMVYLNRVGVADDKLE